MASFYSDNSCVQFAIPFVMVASLKEELESIATLYTPALLHLLQLFDTYEASLSEAQSIPLFLESPMTTPTASPTATPSRTLALESSPPAASQVKSSNLLSQAPQRRRKKKCHSRNGNRSAPPLRSARLKQLAKVRTLRLRGGMMEGGEMEGGEDYEKEGASGGELENHEMGELDTVSDCMTFLEVR